MNTILRCPACDIEEVPLREDGRVATHSLHIIDTDTGINYTYRTHCDGGPGRYPVEIS